MIIKCGICHKEVAVKRMSTNDIMPEVGWICPDCLTSDPMKLDLKNNQKKEEV
jgi:hypothetical protein